MAPWPSFPPRKRPSGEAAQALARGDIVAFPTETVYGLGANALDAPAVAKVFAAKERPRFNPLIVHVPGLAEAEAYAVINETARKLAEAFWPGPLSLVLQKRPACAIADLVSAGLDTIALRAPAHPVARALLAAAKLPIAAPSANRSGRISPTTAAHVEAELGDRPAMILDGGPCPLGLESTVVGVVGLASALLRPGALPREAIEVVLGGPLAAAKAMRRAARRDSWRAITRPPRRSGSTRPRPPRRGAARLRPRRATRGPRHHQSQRERRSRRGRGQALRCAPRARPAGARAIAVMPIPAHGLGEAINDRLQRAANQR